jgi:type VI protein secretion system component Hcp
MTGFTKRHAGALIIASAILLGAGLSTQSSFAAVDGYLQIAGVKGASTEDKHKDWIVVKSFSWGKGLASSQASTMASAGSGGGTGKVAFHDFTITKLADSASPKLAQFASTGQHIPKMVLDMGGRIYTFDDAMITSVKRVGQDEMITVAYTRVTHRP